MEQSDITSSIFLTLNVYPTPSNASWWSLASWYFFIIQTLDYLLLIPSTNGALLFDAGGTTASLLLKVCFFSFSNSNASLDYLDCFTTGFFCFYHPAIAGGFCLNPYCNETLALENARILS
jgi:hypothetical protein